MSLIKSLNAAADSFARSFRRIPSSVWIVVLLGVDGFLISKLMGACGDQRGGGVDDGAFISPDTTIPVNKWLPDEKGEEAEVVVPDVVLDTTKVDLDPGTIDETDGDLMTGSDNAPVEEPANTAPSTSETPTNTGEEEEVF